MKRKIKIYLLLSVLGLFSFMAKGQEDSLLFSLMEAQQYALKNSYVLKNTNRDIIKAEQKVWETISTGLPQVTGTMDYTKNISAAKSPFPVGIIPKEYWPVLGIPEDTPLDGFYPLSLAQKFNSNFGFGVSQQIFDGSWIVGVSSAELYVDLSKQAHEKAEIDIRDAVTRAYYMVLVSIEYKEIMEDNLNTTQELYDETKIYYENGFREEQDVDQIKLLLRNAESEVLRADRELTIAKVVLKYAMGYNLEMEINLTDNLQQYLLPITTKGDIIQFDFNNHIDYRLAVSNFQVSEKVLKLEKVSYLPKLNGFYNYGKSAFGDNANLFKDEWYKSSIIGFQASVPIFNSGQKMKKVQQAKIDVDKAKTQRKLTELTLQKDYLTAKAQMESALERFENDKENRVLAEKIRDKTNIKFDNGLSSSTELSQIETQYIDSYRALVTSILQLLQADLDLKKAVGKL